MQCGTREKASSDWKYGTIVIGSASVLLDDHLKKIPEGLVYLLEREWWDSTANREHVLSLGVQRRLVMAYCFSIILTPKYGILVECINATSVDVEEHMYRLATNMGTPVVTSSQVIVWQSLRWHKSYW